jgi:hypothetical protein
MFVITYCSSIVAKISEENYLDWMPCYVTGTDGYSTLKPIYRQVEIVTI